MTENQLQPGEEGAELTVPGGQASGLDAASIQEQMAEISDKVENKTLPLSEKVKNYAREHLRKVQVKLGKGEPVYPSDLEFIGKVKFWMRMPEDLRKKYISIEKMEKADEVIEANKRNISLRQWIALLYVAGFKAERGKMKEWIDSVFRFPGGGKIRVDGDLDLNHCEGLAYLPDNLSVQSANLSGCTSLKALPEGFYAEGVLSLGGCTSLVKLPDGLMLAGFLSCSGCTALTHIPEDLSVTGDVDLRGCTALEYPSNNLSVGGDLWLANSNRLTHLPENLSVRMYLHALDCAGLTGLPDGIKAGGLHIVRCEKFSYVPDDLSVYEVAFMVCPSLRRLPENMAVKSSFVLKDCANLAGLPMTLSVGESLNLIGEISGKARADAKRLKKEGKIKGKINYQKKE